MTAFQTAPFRWLSGIAAVVILGSTPDSCLAEGVRSVRQILEIKDSWPLFAETETSFVIQGHLGSKTNDEIHMRNCNELRFFLKRPEMSLPRRPRGDTMFKLTGNFTYREDTPVFEIEKIESTSTFVQQYRSKAAATGYRDDDGWRKLAANTKAEAIFNKSDELHALAKEAYIQACRGERAAAERVTDEQMTGWIAEMRKFGVEKVFLDQWEHERLWMKWNSIRSKRDPDLLLRFAGEVARSFPESRTALELPQPKLDESYRKNPQAVFEEADADRRQRLLRLFYMNVTRTEILMNADPKGKNADEILERLRGSLPDEPDLINHYEDLWLSWRYSQLPQASREAAIALSKDYHERNLPKKARETLEIWLEARLENWRKEGARGLVRASEEYLTLLEDEQTALELLQKAWKLAPGEEDTRLALEQLGYRWYDGDWITEQEFKKLPPDPTEEAIKAGEVLLGMSPDEVTRALGKATEIKTSVSAGQVCQAWIYGEANAVRTVVHLLRSSPHPVEQARVVAIGEIRPQPVQAAPPADETEQQDNPE